MADDTKETVSLMPGSDVDVQSLSLSSKPSTPHATSTSWRWAFLTLLLVSWGASMAVFLPRLWSGREPRDGFNLVYWTPHKTGSTSMRLWLSDVAKELELKIGLAHKYPNKLHEDHHARAKRMGLLNRCGFIAGHIRVTPVRSRNNELRLGAVVTTVREPYLLLASKYFHRTRTRLDQKALAQFHDPSSQTSRKWFFYFNDLDPCEQLRYYDGLEGCVYSKLDDRVRRIADRIDCVVNTDDSKADLVAICNKVGLNSSANGGGECPRMTIANRKRDLKRYKELMKIPHIVKVMERTVYVTQKLTNALLKRSCRFFDDPDIKLETPGMQPPNWPFKGCNEVVSSLQSGADEDAPEYDPGGDTVLEVEELGFEGVDDDDVKDDGENEDGDNSKDEDKTGDDDRNNGNGKEEQNASDSSAI